MDPDIVEDTLTGDNNINWNERKASKTNNFIVEAIHDYILVQQKT